MINWPPDTLDATLQGDSLKIDSVRHDRSGNPLARTIELPLDRVPWVYDSLQLLDLRTWRLREEREGTRLEVQKGGLDYDINYDILRRDDIVGLQLIEVREHLLPILLSLLQPHLI